MGERTDEQTDGRTQTCTRAKLSLFVVGTRKRGGLLAGELFAAGDIKRELRPNLCPRVLDGLITSHRLPRRASGVTDALLRSARRRLGRYRKHRKLRPDYIPDTRYDPRSCFAAERFYRRRRAIREKEREGERAWKRESRRMDLSIGYK